MSQMKTKLKDICFSQMLSPVEQARQLQMNVHKHILGIFEKFVNNFKYFNFIQHNFIFRNWSISRDKVL